MATIEGAGNRMPFDGESDHYQSKADFGDVYNQPDPRSYYRTLGALDYEIPAHGAAVFDLLLDEMGGRAGMTVLDVCCGYSANAALLNYGIELADLYEHYGRLENAAADDIAEIDRRWFAGHSRPDAVPVIGLDVAGNAVRYATLVGLLDQGVVADLETGQPDEGTTQVLAAADLVAVTGGIGYVGEKTFRAIVEASGDDPPWVAAPACAGWTMRPSLRPWATWGSSPSGLRATALPSAVSPTRRNGKRPSPDSACGGSTPHQNCSWTGTAPSCTYPARTRQPGLPQSTDLLSPLTARVASTARHAGGQQARSE